MPRDVGTGLYRYPDGTPGTPNQTIFSTRYNTFINDLQLTLNQALPIVAGGTGGTSAATARTNLQAERSAQEVTNYDAHVWEFGSFFSQAGATGAPSANICSGIAYGANANYMMIEARDLATGILYVRQRGGGAWGAWTIDGADRYVDVAGDTMTGNLKINKASPNLTFDTFSSGQANTVAAQVNHVYRWLMHLGDGSAETGANAGSNFALLRCNDAGVATPSFVINRAAGEVIFSDKVTASGSTGGMAVVVPAHKLEVPNASGGAAYMAFNRVGSFAAILGIDSDNQLKYGGWSYGAVAHRILHEGNTPNNATYIKFPSGLMFVWGITPGGADAFVTFPVAFTTACLGVVVTPLVASPMPNTTALAYNTHQRNVASFYLQPRFVVAGGVGVSGEPCAYFAWGY